MKVLSIDPGPTESAWMIYGSCAGPAAFLKEPNEVIRDGIRANCRQWGVSHLAIEMVASFGMPVGAEVFETVLWAGRFIEAAGVPFTRVYRKDVKMCLCHNMRAKDSNIRQAIIDRFGGQDAAIGKKKNPGPLFGVAGDCWSALAVAITWTETIGEKA